MKLVQPAIPEISSETPISSFIREMCERFGPRLPGTAAEAKAAAFLAETMKGFCDEVLLEEHSFSPHSIDWTTTFHLVLYLSALASYLYAPAGTIFLMVAALLIFYLSRIKGYEVLEQFYPRENTQNLTGKIRPAGETRQIVIFSGHHDSAYYMPIFEKRFQKVVLPLLLFIFLAHGLLLVAAATRILGVSRSLLWLLSLSHILFYVSVAGGISFLLFWLFLYRKVGVMGANDNLAGVAVAVAAGRHFASQRPDHVEVWIVSFGAEEASLRGSKRYAKGHLHELKDAVLVNLEMVGAGNMVVVAGERMAGTRHSPEVVELILQAASASGKNLRSLVGPFGETDASSFSRQGLKAATIASLDEDGAPPKWHVFEDDPDNVDETHLKDALNVCIECVNIIEKRLSQQK